MLRIVVKVVPSSGKQLLLWDERQQLLKCYLKSAPEKNKANEELVSLFAQMLALPKAAFVIVGGVTARRKTLSIETHYTLEQLYERLGFEGAGLLKQQSIR